MEDFKSEVINELLEIKRELKKKDDMNFHELLEIKREMKKKDNIILDLLGRLDANQRQQNDTNQGQENGQIHQTKINRISQRDKPPRGKIMPTDDQHIPAQQPQPITCHRV